MEIEQDWVNKINSINSLIEKHKNGDIYGLEDLPNDKVAKQLLKQMKSAIIHDMQRHNITTDQITNELVINIIK